MTIEKDRNDIGLPRPVFLYHLDQICAMLQIKHKELVDTILWFDGREIGVRPRDMLRAINIAPYNEPAQWRVEESEFIRWAKVHNFKTYERVPT